jgi:uncharacterized protein (TIGR02444 family)
MPEQAMPGQTEDAGAAFWSFSLELYARPGVSEAVITLQDEHGLDVNLVLWLLWVGWSGRGRAAADDITRVDAAAAPWRHDVIQPLRTARRALKGSPVAGAEALRTEVKALELESERLQHHNLAALVPAEAGGRDRLADAEANLAVYVTERADIRATLTAALRSLQQ